MDRDERIWTLAMIVFGILWLLALAAPYVVLFTHGSWWAVVTGILVPVLWLISMPCTCSTGGLHASCMGMMQFVSGVLWAVIGLVKGIGLFF